MIRGLSACIINELLHSPTFADNKHERALPQKDILRKCLLTSLSLHKNIIKISIKSPGLLFLSGNLCHVRKEASGFQLEKGLVDLGLVVWLLVAL